MADEKERRTPRRGRVEGGESRSSRQRPEEATHGGPRSRDDVRMAQGGAERTTFFTRAQERRSRRAGGMGATGGSRHWGEVDEFGRMEQRGGYGPEGGQGGYRAGAGGSPGGESPRRGPHSGRGEQEEEFQPEYRPERGGRSERYYGGARSMGGHSEPGYEGGHGETSMGGRADYADYSNEPGWEPTYGSGWQEQERAGRRRTGGRWQREPLQAREIMTKDVRAATAQSSIRDVAAIMRDENTGIVPIVDEDRRLLGVITDRDIVMRSVPEGRDPSKLRATELMTDDVECVTPDESVRDVIRLMGENQVRRIPVVDASDRLVGIIAMADIATRADYDEALQEALEEISAKRSFWSRLFG